MFSLDRAGSRNLFFLCLFAVLLASRLCHLNILWAEEGYGSAGAVQILHGKMIYRDFWFDKPPLAALMYTLWGGAPGWGLRLAGAVFGLFTAWSAWWCAAGLWSRREAYWAAGLITFFLIFDIPPAVMTLGPDLLVVPLALAAVGCAVRGRPLSAGLCCTIALACNAKSILIVPAILIWLDLRGAAKTITAFLGSTALVIALLAFTGSLPGYWEQVWLFGSRYSNDTFVEHPLKEALIRSLNWLGFHFALVVPALVALLRESSAYRRRFLFWLCLSAIGVWAGERFFPRYFLILVPPVTLLAARGYTLLAKWPQGYADPQTGTNHIARSQLKMVPNSPKWRWLLYGSLALLLVPLVRFGPRYVSLAYDLISNRPTQWSDVALNQDSQQVASVISEAIRTQSSHAQSSTKQGPSLLVWGYRPDLFAYTRLPAATPYLDSQLLTGVLADRHLTSTHRTLIETDQNRLALTREEPTFIIDGLGPLNPSLAITQYPELQSWLRQHYRQITQTRDSIVYQRQ